MKTATLVLVALSAFAFGGCVSKQMSLSETSVVSPRFPLEALPSQKGVVIERKTSRVFLVEINQKSSHFVFFANAPQVGQTVWVTPYIVENDPSSVFYEGQ